ncbi:unnamed protein product [Rotaria sp. Silwood2]|nr:unnamed protein product [Rotaria sp. Silwood2]CAF2819468.1 unnamed protein product [Rotaria sp. Silwood2]CAF3233008.1 unnamed protein product [Rotaria sp. Silwood2]CAF4242599.1 unnamed protein product [Rotaria sp. Silwood2]CAF4265749.1 unnamed protein product [Rotaria sp. Silwood2]
MLLNARLSTITFKTPLVSIQKREDKSSRENMAQVDTSQARSNIEVVRMCLQQLGWKECASGASMDSDIYWHSATFQEGDRNFAFTSAKVNKFPGKKL